jgi:hypothetical protein
MANATRIENAVLNARTALTLGRGTWRLRAGRLPWISRRTARRRSRANSRR